MAEEITENEITTAAPEAKEARDGRFEIYQDFKANWRFRFVTANGNTIAVSSESYERRVGAAKAVEMLKLCGEAKVEFLD